MKKFFFAALGLLSLSLPAAASQRPDPIAIVRKMESQLRGTSMVSEAALKVVRGDESRSIGFVLVTEGTEKALVRVTAPIRDKHFSQLRIGEDIWRYTPKVDQIHRVAGSEMNSAWMGSDITYEDIVRNTQISSRYSVAIVGEAKVQGLPAYKIEANLKKRSLDAPAEKMHVWISKNGHTLLRQDLFGIDGKVRRRLETKRIEKIAGIYLPTSFVVRSFPAPRDHYTTLEYDRVSVNERIPPMLFSQATLRRREEIDFIPKRMLSGSPTRSARR